MCDGGEPTLRGSGPTLVRTLRTGPELGPLVWERSEPSGLSTAGNTCGLGAERVSLLGPSWLPPTEPVIILTSKTSMGPAPLTQQGPPGLWHPPGATESPALRAQSVQGSKRWGRPI